MKRIPSLLVLVGAGLAAIPTVNGRLLYYDGITIIVFLVVTSIWLYLLAGLAETDPNVRPSRVRK